MIKKDAITATILYTVTGAALAHKAGLNVFAGIGIGLVISGALLLLGYALKRLGVLYAL